MPKAYTSIEEKAFKTMTSRSVSTVNTVTRECAFNMFNIHQKIQFLVFVRHTVTQVFIQILCTAMNVLCQEWHISLDSKCG